MKLIYIGAGLLGLYIILGIKKSADAGSTISISLTDTEAKVMSFADIMISEGYKQAMDPAAIAAVIQWESGGNPNANRKEYNKDKINWATSYGLMQLLDPTANWLKGSYPALMYDGHATKDNPGNLYDPATNIQIGTKYLYNQFMRYGRNLRDAYAAYNAGTCFVKELGYIKECYTGQWGVYCSGSGDEEVNNRVLGFYSLLKRYRIIFNQIYENYSDYFNPVNFQ